MYYRILLSLFFLLFVMSCNADDNDETVGWSLSFPIANNPLPQNDTLRVLAIGNSFTIDAVSYLGDIVAKSGVDRSKCCVYATTLPNRSLEQWSAIWLNGDTITAKHYAGSITMPISQAPLREVVAQPWDVIVLQQRSSLSDDYSSFNPYLRNLVSGMLKECTNKRVSFAWQFTWSYWEGYTDAKHPKENEGYEAILSAVQQMCLNDGIDIIIPSGIAVQEARNSELNNAKSFTLDGRHITYGLGRYVIACTWFEAIFTPVYGISVLGNTSIHTLSAYEKDNDQNAVSVTAENREACQRCAVKAVERAAELIK